MKDIFADDIVWDVLEDATVTHVILYNDVVTRPRGWNILNPLAWIRYWRRGEIIAYWEL